DARPRAAVATRPENPRHRRSGRPRARLAARHPVGAGRHHGGAMGARTSWAVARAGRIVDFEAKRPSFLAWQGAAIGRDRTAAGVPEPLIQPALPAAESDAGKSSV